MSLHRFRLQPSATWVTPWQADTLMGMVACTMARTLGVEVLERELLNPWRRGEPPFVLSDAFPGDLFPTPASLALFPWPEKQRKLVKRIEWLTAEQFREVQAGQPPALDGVPRPLFFGPRTRNTLDRLLETTGSSGSLYDVPIMTLTKSFSHLSVYARVVPEKKSLLTDSFTMLSMTGFGADASVGQGQFSITAIEEIDWLTEVESADGWISLSTFQPGPRDSTSGYWRSFLKYGRLGPDFGVNGVFKRPQWMLRPGACFRQPGTPRKWAGRVIESEQLLPERTLGELRARDVHPVQPAFALPVPMRWDPEL